MEVVRTNEGKNAMDSIRAVGANMTNREFEMLKEQPVSHYGFRVSHVLAHDLGIGFSAVLYRFPAKGGGTAESRRENNW